MKKLFTAALAAALLLIPFGAIAADDQVEIPLPPVVDYVPGTAPAEITVADTMSPALHAATLAMLNHQTNHFDPADRVLAWEALYNMLSMYGQLDQRAQYQGEYLLVPDEIVADYASALLPEAVPLGALPQVLSDRMSHSAAAGSYLVVCGNDDLSRLDIQTAPLTRGQLLLTGALVNEEDGSQIAAFQAVVQRADNLLGCELVSMDLL